MRNAMAVWGVLAAGLVRGATQTLWPSEQSEAHALPDSRAAVLEGGAVRVEAGANYDWPGVRVGFKAGSADLSAFDVVRVALRNVGCTPVQLYLGFKNQRPKDWFLAPKGSVRLQPGERGEIVASLRLPPFVTDRQLGLAGMHGKPGPLAGEIFDLSLVHELHISLDAARAAATFELLGIVVESREAERAMLAADRFFPFVDRFGQFAHTQWPGKIRDEAELRTAREREAAALAADAGSAEWDRWGGWARGPQLKATGRFRTEKVNGKWWLVDPDGRLFFSHGVDGVMAGQATGVTGRERYFAWLPAEGDPLSAFIASGGHMPYRVEGAAGPYRTYDFVKANLFRKYGAEWEAIAAEAAHRRLRAWGLNTVANWSEPRVCALRRTPYVATVNGAWRSIANACPDPFSAGFTNELHGSMQALKASGAADDPWCLGAFVDNEMGWGAGNSPSALAREVLKLPSDRAAKRAFVQRLQKKYADIGALNAAWKTSFESWDMLLKNAEAPETWSCDPDCAEFLTEFADRYFSTVRDALKAVAPNLLYLGCRFAWGPDPAYRAASRYCDVVSLNLYRHTVCKDLPEGCEDKPILIGEFHFGAMDRGAFHTGLGIANNQAERAELYKGYLRSALAHPRCVGTHWFQWSDQPLTGRGDGENYPVGFVSVADGPYPELTSASREIGSAMYAGRFAGLEPLVAETRAASLTLREQALRRTLAKDTCWPGGVWGDNLWTLSALYLNEKTDVANARLLKQANDYIGRAGKNGRAPAPTPEQPGDAPWTFFSITDYVRTLCLFHARSPHFPGRLRPETEAAMKAALWLWVSEESRLADAGPDDLFLLLGTENHDLNRRPNYYLVTALLKEDPAYRDRKLADGHTPAEHADAYTAFFRAWPRSRARAGLWVEIGSNTYQKYSWPALFSLHELAPDPVVRLRFGLLLDLAFIEEAQLSVQGRRGGGRSRADYGPHAFEAYKNLLFAVAAKPAGASHSRVIETSRYQLPAEAIRLCKQGFPQAEPFVIRNRVLGESEPLRPEDPDGQRLAADSALVNYAYRTPSYLLGSTLQNPALAMPDPKTGGASLKVAGISRQKRCCGLLFDNPARATVSEVYPAVEHTGGGRSQHSFWSVQQKNVLILQRIGRHGKSTLGSYNTGTLGMRFEGADLEKIEEDGWIFASNGKAFAGVKFLDGGYQWDDKRTHASPANFTGPGDTTRILLQAGDLFSHGSFGGFRKAARACPLIVTADKVTVCFGEGKDILEMSRYDAAAPSTFSLPLINRKPVELRPAAVYESPFLNGTFGSDRITVKVGPVARVLDFGCESGDQEAGTECVRQ